MGTLSGPLFMRSVQDGYSGLAIIINNEKYFVKIKELRYFLMYLIDMNLIVLRTIHRKSF